MSALNKPGESLSCSKALTFFYAVFRNQGHPKMNILKQTI